MKQAPLSHLNTNPYIPVEAELVDKRVETSDTTTLIYKSGQNKHSFLPGQFNMLFVPGIGEVPVSISGSPAKDNEIIHTVRDVGAVTSHIVHSKIGSRIGLRGPFGLGWPAEKGHGKDVTVIAGGIGLAPLRPLIYKLIQDRDKYKKVNILYGTRTPGDLLYREELHEWLARFDIHVEISVDRDDADWHGHVGVITRFIPLTDFDAQNSVAMICGPEIMIRYSVRELQALGVPDSDIYVSMERNMRCGIGHCGHCQFGPDFVCKDGPVFPFDSIKKLFMVKEV